jgi:DNA-binding transcriptional LysR family regulator
MFDISLLRCFVTVAEEMHFGRAAERMNMSQPPFSRQIQILEHVLAVKLLERTSRSVKLTPAGQIFLPEARHILNLLDNATLLAKRVALGKSGSVKIGFTAMAAFGGLPRLVAASRQEFPHVELILQEASTADQLRKLNSSEIDFAILRPPIEQAQLQSFSFWTESLIAAIPASHPLSEKPKIKLRDLTGEPFIHICLTKLLPLQSGGRFVGQSGCHTHLCQQLTGSCVMALVRRHGVTSCRGARLPISAT